MKKLSQGKEVPMTKKDLFIVHLLQSALQGVADDKVQVITMPITAKLEGEWCVRLKIYVNNVNLNHTTILLDMPITGLEMRWMAVFLSYCGYIRLSASIERHRRKYFEDVGFHVQLRPSLLKLWDN